MSGESSSNYYENLVPKNYLNIASDAEAGRKKLIRILLEKKKIPDIGWDDMTIEMLVNELARLDSNNFINTCGVGEREGRVICNLVARRHYNFSHGLGRSGDLVEPQPKAAGSSIMSKLTNHLLLDLLKMTGIHSVKKCLLIPMATGMSLVLCLLTLAQKKPQAKYVLWSRIDQKACFKSIITAGLTPIIIDPILGKDKELITDLECFAKKINELGASNILAIFSTTSCFAPRTCDNIVGLGNLAKKYDIFHLVNNAYGLQSTFLTHQLEQGCRDGRLDLFVQSTDKNLLVPVGGAIVASSNPDIIDEVGRTYAGRSSASQTLDVFMTLLSIGRVGYGNVVAQRKMNFLRLTEEMSKVAEQFNEEILFPTKRNPISIAMTLGKFERAKCSAIGSMLFTRGISGARVVNPDDDKTIEGYTFKGWGSHSADVHVPYLTVAAGLGIETIEIEQFVRKIVKILEKFQSS